MFGYEDVDEEKVNRETNSDFESAGFFKIRASTADAALKWGRTLSGWYVAAIFGDESPSRWARGEFAAWLEEEPDDELSEAIGQTAAVEDGEYPDLDKTRLRLHD